MSRLCTGYPQADPKVHIVWANAWQKDIDPIFAGRVAALCRDHGKVGLISSGFRSLAEQIKLYVADGGRQLPNGDWIGGTGYVGKPGASWHNWGGAIDTTAAWLKAIDKDAATIKQKTLLKYGLYKPLTRGNGCTVLEDWHIQPIETIGLTNTLSKKAFFNGYKNAATWPQIMWVYGKDEKVLRMIVVDSQAAVEAHSREGYVTDVAPDIFPG